MPIQCNFDAHEIDQKQFQEIDYEVMRLAFDIQNRLGRLCHESIYHTELTHQCSSLGLPVVSEGEIVVSLDSFIKSYYLDALVGRGAVYELKDVSDLHGHHEAQLLNYLFLLGLRHGKLVNFSSPSVQCRFVSTQIDVDKRFRFEVEENSWRSGIPSSGQIRDIVLNVMTEWGAYLDISLYREAVFHFLGGDEKLVHPVDICIEGRLVGHQKMHLLDDTTGLHVSSVVRYRDSYQKQLLRVLKHTCLKQIQWVNFNRRTIELATLGK